MGLGGLALTRCTGGSVVDSGDSTKAISPPHCQGHRRTNNELLSVQIGFQSEGGVEIFLYCFVWSVYQDSATLAVHIVRLIIFIV